VFEMFGLEYDKDYFERGPETGKSTYKNYTWMPEFTIPMAMTIIDYLSIERGAKVLDYGCAKGYLVKAFRMLYRDAWGVDVSKYAIDNIDMGSKPYCFQKINNLLLGSGVHKFPGSFDFCVAKDVFEHIPEPDLKSTLEWINSKYLFVIVPLGNGKKYNAPLNDLDTTHIHKWSLDTWEEFIAGEGWDCLNKKFKVDGIKESYYDTYPRGHGFLTFKKIGFEM